MKRHSLRGFTLLEILLSVMIFLLLAGGIFAAVTVATKASSEIAMVRLDAERFDSLQGFLRRLFSNLPGAAHLELRVRQANSHGSAMELLISPAPEFARFSQHAFQGDGLSLAAIPDGAGGFVFSLMNFDAESSGEKRDRQLETSQWISMLPNVSKIRWRFAGIQTPGLQETWQPNNGRPGLADLQITLADGSEKHWQFLIPAVIPLSEGGGR